ncbi:Misexpression suppressor of ras 4 [Carabus blaptoides fortunei]
MSAYWNSMDFDSEGTLSTKISSSTSPPERRYVDPWDLENYAYMKQRYDSRSPSAAGEPLDASFYYTPCDKEYELYKTSFHAEEDAGMTTTEYEVEEDEYEEEVYLDNRNTRRRSPTNYYHQPYSDGDVFGLTPDYSDMDDMSEGECSPPVTDGSLLYMYETATRCRKMAVPRTDRTTSAVPVYQVYGPAEDILYSPRKNTMPIYDDISVKKTKPGNFGLSNYGHLKIDYSFSWNSLDIVTFFSNNTILNTTSHESELGMEDGDCGAPTVPAPLNHEVDVTAAGVLVANDRIASSPASSDMANYPDVEVSVINNKTTNNTNSGGKTSNHSDSECNVLDNKLTTVTTTPANNNTTLNGQSDRVHSDEHEDEYTSDEEALVIDEQLEDSVQSTLVTRKRVRSPSPRANFKGFKKRIIAKSIHYRKVVNDLKNASFYIDLKENKDGLPSEQQSDQQDQKRCCLNVLKPTSDSVVRTSEPPRHKATHKPVTRRSTTKRRPSQKLTEYAQYLGLQPAVKFKCVKCSESSFQSLSSLNDHQRHCLSQPASSSSLAKSSSSTSARGGGGIASSAGPTSTNFRVTRKVFLCSSCGTYYENCNLFLHMREVHRRYICLYCLGMFSLPEKLSHHLITKHNCSPNHYASAEDFLSSYTDSCFLVCCHCERVFSERDNFFGHICVERRTPSDRVCASCGVTGTSAHLSTCKGTGGGGGLEAASTTTGTSCSKPVTQVEHVTADSASTSVHEPDKEVQTEPVATEEMNAAEHFMAAAASSPDNTKQHDTDAEQPQTETTTVNTSEAMCIEATSTETVPVQEKPDECEPPVENDVTEDKDENQQKDMSPQPETTEAIVPDEHPESDTDKQDTKSSEVNDTVDERKSVKEEPVLSESSDESVLSEAEPEQQSDAAMVEEPKLQDTADTNGSPVPSPAANADVNEPAELQEVKDESEDAKESSDHQEKEEEQEQPVVQDTRKVPKVRLKLPPQSMVYSENESDDSEKLTMEVEDNGDSDEGSKTADDSQDKLVMNGYEEHSAEEEYVPVAGEDVPIVELELEQPLDKFTMESLLRRCLGATIPTCVYCNHARKIAVNGKQLGLHAIAEHRFAATVNSITAEELIPASFVTRIKECLREVESVYFCLDVQEDTQDEVTSYKRVYECFQCRYVTTVHKELYLHNRKMHAKTILLCIMCKSNFYSYSELICHLCPGNYVLHSETMFRCCMCSANDLPSAFRLMVHLRKRHHTCDVCLEGCHNQSKLSNHVWKHKLHHLCYRCGIAYRNKPDITKHLFWKHGTESVLCKRCLQKKWPHVYHFCIPPAAFVCEECSHSFTKAVYLKVHKRLHSQEKPHACTETGCTERFISKKLQVKHEARHREPIPLEQTVNEDKVTQENTDTPMDTEQSDTAKQTVVEVKPEDAEHAQESVEEPKKSLIDVYDLPALNLSESDSESEDEKPKLTAVKSEQEDEKKVDMINETDGGEKKMDTTNSEPVPTMTTDEDQKPVPILDGIWDNFKNYQATIEKRDSLNPELADKCDEMKVEPAELEEEYSVPDLEAIMADHDYCLPPEPPQLAEPVEGPLEKVKTDVDSGMDHDYCTVGKNQETSNNNQAKAGGGGDVIQDTVEKKKSKSMKKKSTKHAGSSSSSDSSSDSESSSCTCGSNCSCSSSSGSSSSSSSSSDSDSSSSEGKRRLQARRERRKERAAKRKKDTETSQTVSNTSPVDVVATEDPPALPLLPVIELPIEESDLDTDETETDEDFYDEHPQRLANKIMAEKRNQLALLAAVAPVNNGGVIECSPPSTPNLPEPEPAPPVEAVAPTPTKKKVKAKKRKKKSRSSTPKHEAHNIPEYNQQINHRHRRKVVSPAVVPTPTVTDSNVRSSKRRRVPNKFYGYSSDEDAHDKPGSTLKWRKSEITTSNATVHHVTGSPQFVPPITIKNIPSPAPVVEPLRAPVIHHEEPAEDSDSDEEEEEVVAPVRKSSSDSSGNERNDDSDSDTGQLHIISQPPAPAAPVLVAPPIGYSAAAMAHHQAAAAAAAAGGERSNENLYCYCQCPYDEVSEMIACDGKDCAIEWFHFECVGIMVPPKGKWFCPDCRRKTLGGAAPGRSDFVQT